MSSDILDEGNELYLFRKTFNKRYCCRTQRSLYSKDYITYYKNFEDLIRTISIFIHNIEELRLSYSFALGLISILNTC